MFFDTRYIFASEVKYNWLSQLFFLFFLFISCHFSKLVAFFSSHFSSKLVASTFLCLVDSVVVHKKLGTLMSTPFANVICRLLSHLHFLMSKLKRAQDHLQNVISRTLALFWESFALVTTMHRWAVIWLFCASKKIMAARHTNQKLLAINKIMTWAETKNW